MGDEPVFANRSKRGLKPEVVEEIPIEDRGKQLPTPVGYKLLIMLPVAAEKTEGGIIKAETTKQQETVNSVTGYVQAMGPDAYSDKTRFPNGPYCKVGDFIIMKAYAGTRILIHGVELRLINDDSVDAIVDDPRGISKA
jgi:co-chaperonin GroES (HSP10)